MAKPIFLLEIPASLNPENNQISEIDKKLVERLSDYNVLICVSSVKELKFTTFYEKDLQEVDFEEFKNLVNEKLLHGQESKV